MSYWHFKGNSDPTDWLALWADNTIMRFSGPKTNSSFQIVTRDAWAAFNLTCSYKPLPPLPIKQQPPNNGLCVHLFDLLGAIGIQ